MLEVRKKDFFKRNWGLILSLASLLVDFFLLNLSFLLVFLIFSGDLAELKIYSHPIIFVNVLFLLMGLGFGIYRSRYNFSTKNLRSYYIRVILYLTLLTMAYLFIIEGEEYSPHILLITFLIMYVFFEMALAFSKKIQNYLAKKRFIGFKTLIIGTDARAWEFTLQIKQAFATFFHILGYVQKNHKGNQTSKEINPSIIGNVGELEALIQKYRPDVVFIISETLDIDKYADIHKVCNRNSIKLKIVSPKVNHILSHSKIRDVLGVSLVFESWRIYYWRFNSRLKRIFDVLFVIVTSPIILPLGIIISVIIKLTSSGPVYFKQRRALYEGGPEFLCYKFRSMYKDAEDMKENLLGKNEASGALFKIKNDPRITPFGRIIRKFSLDELPQFINVLKNEMSIIGPRPLPLEDFKKNRDMCLNPKWQRQRGIVKPGITGLWQIMGRSNLRFEEMLFLDFYYTEHQSPLFDIEIFFATLPSMLSGKGAY